MPHKYNAARRHHIPRPKRRVTNWAAYNEALRQRGSLTVWFTEDAIAAWKAEPRTTPGGQPYYSDLAITTALTLRAVFRLALRQTEGLVASIIALLGLDLAVPDHSTLSRRAETLEVPRPGREPTHLLVDSTGLKLCGPGEWLVEKHGTRTRRGWRKLHLWPPMPTRGGSSPSVAAWAGREHRDTASALGWRPTSQDGNASSVTACVRRPRGARAPRWPSPPAC